MTSLLTSEMRARQCVWHVRTLIAYLQGESIPGLDATELVALARDSESSLLALLELLATRLPEESWEWVMPIEATTPEPESTPAPQEPTRPLGQSPESALRRILRHRHVQEGSHGHGHKNHRDDGNGAILPAHKGG